MASAPSEAPPAAYKLLVAGGFGAGKTTMVGAISEVRPLLTEERLSREGEGVDDLSGVSGKTTTTVALDFGRITLGMDFVVYLFGVPGQERFWFMWDELAFGALGAVVLADVRRLADCFSSLNYFEKAGLPFVVAINRFDDAPHYRTAEVRQALDLAPGVPIVQCDARSRESVKQVLIALIESL
jgi:signal recognition particle receptor subunit beta